MLFIPCIMFTVFWWKIVLLRKNQLVNVFHSFIWILYFASHNVFKWFHLNLSVVVTFIVTGYVAKLVLQFVVPVIVRFIVNGYLGKLLLQKHFDFKISVCYYFYIFSCLVFSSLLGMLKTLYRAKLNGVKTKAQI